MTAERPGWLSSNGGLSAASPPVILAPMSRLPTGVVTLLFTDIEGSTRLLQRLGDPYADALRDHRRILRAAFESHGGIEVDTQGDAFFVVFHDPTDAVR